MTAPVQALPNVTLGNTTSDIGSGAESFVQGLVGQRVRQQQIAMQQALAQANIGRQGAESGLETAQTGGAQAQSALVGHEAEPADDNQEAMYRQFVPTAPVGIFHGMNRAEADRHIQTAQQAHMIGLRLGLSGSSQLTRRFDQLDKPQQEAMSAYNNINDLIGSNTGISTREILGSLARLAMPNNARAVSTMQIALSHPGPLAGPFAAYQNVQNLINKMFTTNGDITLDPVSVAEIKRAANALMRTHQQMHQSNIQRVSAQANVSGLPLDPTELVGENDPYMSLDLSDPQQPGSGGGGLNPRFMPKGP